MKSTTRRDGLERVLTELASLADATPYRQRLVALARRLAENRLRILVVGEAKRGKSTFINALLQRQVLPTGVTPLTALATTLVYGTPERIEVVRNDGEHATYALGVLDELVTETKNPANKLGLTSVTVYLETPLLAPGIELVDTPGTGSVYEHNTHEAYEALAGMDAAAFVLSADPPVSLAELELLERVEAASVATFVLLNKADRLDETELAQAQQFTARTVTERLGRAVTVYPCSARTAVIDGAEPGFDEFLADLHGYLDRERVAGLERSLARQGRELAASMRDEARMTLRTDQLRTRAEHGRISAFREHLDSLDPRRRDAEDLARSQAGHLLDGLNASAKTALEEAMTQVAAELEAWLEGGGASLAPADVERRGRDLVLHTATQAAERWRGGQGAALRDGVARLGVRLAAEFDRDVTAVRGAARDLLGLELSTPETGIDLAGDPRFHYAPPAPEGPAEALAAALRVHAGGRRARRRVHRHLRAELPETVDRQFGRARASLQYRLTETTGHLVATLGERYARYGASLAAALGAAEDIQALGADQAAAHRARLTGKERRLDALITRADALARQGEPIEEV